MSKRTGLLHNSNIPPLGENSRTLNMNKFTGFKNEPGSLKNKRRYVSSYEPYLGKRTTPQEIVIDSEEPPKKKKKTTEKRPNLSKYFSNTFRQSHTKITFESISPDSSEDEFIPSTPVDEDDEDEDDFVQKPEPKTRVYTKKTRTKRNNIL